MLGIGKGFGLFFDDGDTGGTGPVDNLPEVPSASDADADALAEGEDEDEPDPDDADGQDDEDEDDDDDKDEDEEEPEVIDEEKSKKKKDEEEEPVTDDKKVPSIRALKEAYPDIFKKFPHVRTAIAEHQQFRQVYSSVDEAREAAEAQDNFSKLSDKLVDEGDFGFIYDEVAKADPQAAARMAKKILPAILERSKDLYMDITEAPIVQFVHAAFRRAKADGNKNLEHSALHIWKFLGKDGVPSIDNVGPDPKDEEFQNRVKEYEGRKFNDARQSVTSEIRTGLVGLIEGAIDPKGTLKETTKRALVNELIREIDADVSGDRNHMARVDRLWANARRSSFATGHLSRITSAYLDRAKQVLPKHARKVREENNIRDEPKDKSRRSASSDDEPQPRPNNRGVPPRPRTIRDTNPRNIDWRNTSDVDILSGKAVLRKR